MYGIQNLKDYECKRSSVTGKEDRLGDKYDQQIFEIESLR